MKAGVASGVDGPALPPDGPGDLDHELLLALRRCVLAVSVLDDVDLLPGDDGVTVTSGRTVGWGALVRGLRGVHPDDPSARALLSGWLRTLTAVAWRSADDLAGRARPVGLPQGHVLHPGPEWVRERVLGGAIDLGLGFLGVMGDPDRVDVLPAGVLEAAGHADAAAAWWPPARAYLEEMGRLAGDRQRRQPGPLRPMGDCDVITLLASRALRLSLCLEDGTGLRAAAVPVRSRGWLDLSRIDPAFALVAARLADDQDRGFPRPVLVTADEVALAREGGDPVLQALRESAAAGDDMRAVRYR